MLDEGVRLTRKYSYDQRRGSRHKRGYTNQWSRAAKAFLSRNPLCAKRHENPDICTQIATCVDHIRPHNGDRRLFWRKSNWQGLCHACHNRKTAEDVGRSRKGCGVDGWPLSEE